MAEKWQEALNKWDKWGNALNKTTAAVQNFVKKEDYADLEQLLSSAKWSYKIDTDKDGVSVTRIDLDENREAKLLWKLHNIVSHHGSKFIIKWMNLGFEPNSSTHKQSQEGCGTCFRSGSLKFYKASFLIITAKSTIIVLPNIKPEGV